MPACLLACQFYKKKMDCCKKSCKYSRRRWRRKDRISDLPDDVLVYILSLLPGTEAVATCVLSRRWEKLWNFTTGTLSFSHPEWLMVETKSEEDGIKPEFISWVNHAVRLHQGPTLQEFCIQFSLDQLSASDIDTWINFAIGKKVQRLHFDFLRAYNDHGSSEQRNYNFPNLNLLRSRANGFNSFINSLTELYLMYLNVDESCIQDFLTSCPNLEKLCLGFSPTLLNLRVATPLKLKHLEISYCYNLENTEISAPNLEFLKYTGETTSVTLKNVPKLIKAELGHCYAEDLINPIPDHLSFLSQLEALRLEDISLFDLWVRGRPVQLLVNLKRLVLCVAGSNNQSLFPLTYLLKAAPFLHSFEVQLSIYRNKRKEKKRKERSSSVTKYSHQYLKLVKLTGFVGFTIDVEFASHLLEISKSLEKIIICTTTGVWANKLKAKEQANEVKRKLPAGTKLFVI